MFKTTGVQSFPMAGSFEKCQENIDSPNHQSLRHLNEQSYESTLDHSQPV